MTVTIALVAGDPAGIGPELVAKVLAQPETLPDARVGQCLGLRQNFRD